MSDQHICKYCGKSFETGPKLGSHYLHCEKNPSYQDIKLKILDSRSRKNNKKIRTLICVVCGKSYELLLTDNAYNKGKYKKCCCKSCSNKLTFKNKNLESINKKRSEANKSFYKSTHLRVCCNCGVEYWDNINYHSKKYCSKECMEMSRHNKLSIAAKRNNLGGLSLNTTHTFYKKGYYKGIYCDSSWELAYLIYCLEHNISITRNYDFLEYEFEGKKFKFYPDFIVDGKLVEIKGFYTPKNKAKKEQITIVEFIDKEKIQPYLQYVISKYGKNFVNMYD